YPRQFNLRFTPAEYADRRAVAVVLQPFHSRSDKIKISRHRGSGREYCTIEGEKIKIEVRLDPGYSDTGSFMQIRVMNGTAYTVGKSGIIIQDQTDP
ncbi:MAG: hypothetical protein ACLFSE_12990, partial [Spirochaetia bacterium]